MSKLLIIGASILQLPAILKAKELGHFVAVVDYNPEAVGIKYADQFFNVSTVDIDAVCEVAKKIRPDGIMTLATDMPLRSVAASSSLLDLPGLSYETAVKSTDKGEMIKAFKEHNVASPWFFIAKNESDIENISSQLIFPCIVKPTDNAGSRGVILVDELLNLKQAYLYSRKQSRSGEVIIEEFMTGKEVSVEVLVANGTVNILAVTDKLTTGAPHFVEMGHSQPSQLGINDIDIIKNLTIKAAKAIGIELGPAHVEIMLSEKGPKVIELGARMAGDCIASHLVPLSTGIDMVKATIDITLGSEPNIEPMYKKGSAIRYFDVPEGIISSISGIDQALNTEGVKECFFSMGIGDEVKTVRSSTDRIGFIIAQGKNAIEAINVCESAISKINIKTVKK